MTRDETPVVTDACTCINLAAAFELDLAALAASCRGVVVPQVINEALSLHDGVGVERIAVPVTLRDLEMVALSDDELGLYVRFAAKLDDGEAASLAVAYSRGWILATDDKAAIRQATATDPPTHVITTAQILRQHAEIVGWDDARITKAVQDVRSRASFVPPNSDPEHDWWKAHL